MIGIFTKNLFRMWESTRCVGRFFIGIPSDLLAGAIDDRFLTLAAAAAVVVVVVVVRRVYSIFSSLFWEAIVRHRGKSFFFLFSRPGRDTVQPRQALIGADSLLFFFENIVFVLPSPSLQIGISKSVRFGFFSLKKLNGFLI